MVTDHSVSFDNFNFHRLRVCCCDFCNAYVEWSCKIRKSYYSENRIKSISVLWFSAESPVNYLKCPSHEFAERCSSTPGGAGDCERRGSIGEGGQKARQF